MRRERAAKPTPRRAPRPVRRTPAAAKKAGAPAGRPKAAAAKAVAAAAAPSRAGGAKATATPRGVGAKAARVKPPRPQARTPTRGGAKAGLSARGAGAKAVRAKPPGQPARAPIGGGAQAASAPGAAAKMTRARRPDATPAARGLWLYGRHAVEAALANPSRSCHRLLATPEGLAALGPVAGRPGLEVLTVERAEIDRRLGTETVHQGLALSVAPLPRLDLRRALTPEPGRNLVLVLDQVNDPHNVGAILRSAAAFDVRALVLPERRSAELGGTVAKAASGALDLVPVVEVTNLARALEQLAELGYWRLALDAGAEATVDAVPEVDNLALVLGAEGTGLRRLVRDSCDLAARLPIAPAMPSLNVSVACGIALYALARRG